MILDCGKPNERQKQVMLATQRHIAFGGARGGGKSWMVRAKAKGLAFMYPGIRMLIVRRTYPELVENHLKTLRQELLGFARYNDKDKEFVFRNGSRLRGMYCQRDADLDKLQGQEYDVIFFDEATQLSEYQLKAICATLRGVNDFPKRAYYTCNPGGQGHGYIKRVFVDRKYEAGERPDDYYFVQSLVTDNKALMEADPDYIKQLEALPPKLRRAWLYGDWDIFEGQFFEDFRAEPDREGCEKSDLTPLEAMRQHRWTHVIYPFEIPKTWTIMRSFDWGYARPFSCAWWAIDHDGVIYRILELYGCSGEPNVGLKWAPDKVFSEIHRVESEHRWLRGRQIIGVADPAIWNAEYGESIAETADRHMVHFIPGDHERLPGWMQMHYRLMFDAEGRAGMYVFNTCKAFIRTIPLLMYSETKPEDLDTDGEDHVADETRYLCMSRPIRPRTPEAPQIVPDDPLDLRKDGGYYG